MLGPEDREDVEAALAGAVAHLQNVESLLWHAGDDVAYASVKPTVASIIGQLEYVATVIGGAR